MASNSKRNIFQPDYYNVMPDDEFDIFCKRFRILHNTGKYIPPPPKITACKKITTKPDKTKIRKKEDGEKARNTRYGKGLVGRGKGSCKVKYCACCNKRRDEVEQYTARLLGKDVKEKQYPLADTTNMEDQNMQKNSSERNLSAETTGFQGVKNVKPSTSNMSEAGQNEWVPFLEDLLHEKASFSSTLINSDSENDALSPQMNTSVHDEKVVAERKWSADYQSHRALTETAHEPDGFESSCVIIDDTAPPKESNIIDLDNSRFAMPYSPINIADDSDASWRSDDVEIVAMYKIPTNEQGNSGSSVADIKTRAMSTTGTSSHTVSTSTASEKKTQGNTSQGKEKVAQNGSGSQENPIGECPVCLESLQRKEIMSTICGHVFCATCIQNVIRKSKCCPSCRKRLTLKSIHPIYL